MKNLDRDSGLGACVLRCLSLGRKANESRKPRTDFNALENGITSVTLRPVATLKFVIPRCLSEMRFLRRFALVSKRNVSFFPPDWLSLLKSLPRGLETLELCTGDSANAFLNYAPTWTRMSPKYLTTEYSRGSSIHTDVGKLFPLLKALKWSNYAHDCSGIFPALPDTLTALTIIEGRVQMPFWSLLPRSLAHFDVQVEYKPWEPSSSNDRTENTANDLLLDILQAPPGLVASSLTDVSQRHQNGMQQSHSSATQGYRFPDALVRMYSDVRLPQPTLSLLPTSLTHLILVNDKERISKAKYELSHLIGVSWPPLLSSLYIDLFSLDGGILALLPRTLADLKLRMTGSIASETDSITLRAADLPPRLSILRLEMLDSTPSKFEIIGIWPASITEVCVVGAFLFDQRQRFNLPSHLESLDFSFGKVVDGELMELLPDRLTHFKINEWLPQMTFLIPRSMTSLELEVLLTDPQDATAVEKLIGELPPLLTSLRLGKPRNIVTLSATALDRFSLLQSLFLSERIQVPSAILPKLPRSMKVLSVTLIVEKDSDLGFLPPNLSVCWLGSKNKWDMPILADSWPLHCYESAPHRFHMDINHRRKNMDF